ncbi:hypothetical protein ACFODZ_15835 [Marinicella sediminis]|uniref:Bacterial repeat domain-containing protein n=1 Tax=Marinicella sediminis TaxID=1792834 RepID=A0ABV7JI10_9GAMM|nr:hypothetical protein [Marinicella sediminis]
MRFFTLKIWSATGFLLFAGLAQSQLISWLSEATGQAGDIANNTSYGAQISTNGRYVTFGSHASNLINGDDNGLSDVFIRDLQLGNTTLVTSRSDGSQLSSFVSAYSKPTSDGRYVAFVSDDETLPNNQGSVYDHIYLKDLVTGTLTNLSEYGNGLYFDTYNGVHLSDDGQFITFASSDAIDPLQTSFRYQVYRKNLTNNTYELLSISADGLAVADDYTAVAGVSDNGRYVLMASEATNLTNDVILNSRDNLFLRDTQNNTTTLINITPTGQSSAFDDFSIPAAVSNTGVVVFITSQGDLVANDNNGRDDVFVYDNGIINRISLDLNGHELTDGFPSGVDISGDGSRIVFSHNASNLVSNDANDFYDLFSYDPTTETLSLITVNEQNVSANGYSAGSDLSLNGNRLTLISAASDFNQQQVLPGETEIFVHQFSTAQFTKVSTPLFDPHTIIDDISVAFSSSDQMWVVFNTKAANMTPDPVDPAFSHLYLLNRHSNDIQLLVENAGVNGISPSGRFVVFSSNYFHPGGTLDLGSSHIYLYDRQDDSILAIDEGVLAQVNDAGLVVFQTIKSIAANDLNTTYDIYLFDPVTQNISLVSEDLNGLAATGVQPSIGGTGANTFVVFDSESDELVPADTNGFGDVFIKQLPSGPITRVSQTAAGTEGNDQSNSADISADGSQITFITRASNLTTDDYSQAGDSQVLMYDRINTTLSLASKNESGLPLYSDNASIYYSSVSDSGRYVAYKFTESTFDGIDFAGDDDRRDDLVLYDSQTDTGRIISLSNQGQHVDSIVGIRMQVMENTTVTPARIGVLFTARQTPEWTAVANHPGHEELFLYQQGGPDLNLQVVVEGFGQVAGTSGINCDMSCTYDFPLGTELTLVATPDQGMHFVGWSVDFGNCVDQTNPCALMMERDKVLTAHFTDPSEVIFINGFDD